MNSEIKYIELKSGFSHNGPAWIGKVEFSKSGQTIYFNDMALKRLKNLVFSANYFNIETGEEYWISGIKRNGQDRHWAGSGIVLIEEDIREEYLQLVDFSILDKNQFQVINIDQNFDKSRFDKLENEKRKLSEPVNYREWYWDNNRRKLVKE